MRGPDVLAALAVGGLVFLAVLLAFRSRSGDRLRKRLEPHVPPPEEEPKKKRRARLAPLFSVTERTFARLHFWRKLESVLERADSSLSPVELFYLMLGSALVPAIFLGLLGLPSILSFLVLPLGALVPYAVVRSKGTARQRAFDDQLPDLLMTMAASARVGHTFRQGLASVVEEGQEPAATEFKRVLIETDLGRPLERVLSETAQRMGSRNFDYVVNVVTIQREVGGSLAGLFDMVAQTVRQRQQFAKKVRSLTAMGRMSAYVLVSLPFVIVAGMTAINRQFMAPLFTTSTGRMLLFVAFAGIIVGSLMLKKIVSFRMQ